MGLKMNEPNAKGLSHPALTGTVTTIFVAVCSLLPEYFTDNAKQAVLLCSTLLSPFLVSWLIRLHSRVDIPSELVSYLACLDRDLKCQEKNLKKPGLPETTKLVLEQQVNETIMKRGTAYQDFASGKLDLSNLKKE